MRRNRFIRTIGVMLLLFVLATAMYAFTALNTVEGSKAGIGDGAITGYTVSNISYDLDADDPSQIEGVSFTLNAPAGSAYARITFGEWEQCTALPSLVSSQSNWTCAVSGSTLAAVNLEVAAAD